VFYLSLLQTSLGEVQRKGQFHFLRPETRETVERAWANCRETGDPLDVEYHARFRDGTERTIWTHGIRTQTPDGLAHWVGVNIDVTEREQTRQQFHQQAAALQEADRRKDRFLATLAHELRNPLAPLRNALELLHRANGDSTVIDQGRSLMARQLHRVVRLVDDLLDISRITVGKVRLRKERVELVVIVRSAVEAARSLIESRDHEHTVMLPSAPVYLDADPSRLAQVFTNLLDNAAKYTDRGGHIWLTAEQQGCEVRVSVRDTGIGIATEHLSNIFEMFSQIAPLCEQSFGGLGVGLSLARGLVELHGGRIEVRSDGPGRGSRFTVHLQVSEAPVPPPQGSANQIEQDDGASKRRILVVDDNRDSTDSLAALLRLMGHDVHTAYDGLEAVQAAATWRPDVVLLDIGLPRMNGHEVAGRIREQPCGTGMALIALTGWGTEEDKRRALEAGFDHHLTKAVGPAALEKLLALIAPLRQS
jgi:signal transduction histidine kinase/CheY-like chemotaxis protein